MTDSDESNEIKLPIKEPVKGVTTPSAVQFSIVFEFYGGAICTTLMVLVCIISVFNAIVHGKWMVPDFSSIHFGLLSLGLLFHGLFNLNKEPELAKEIFGGRTVSEVGASWKKKFLQRNEESPALPDLKQPTAQMTHLPEERQTPE